MDAILEHYSEQTKRKGRKGQASRRLAPALEHFVCLASCAWCALFAPQTRCRREAREASGQGVQDSAGF